MARKFATQLHVIILHEEVLRTSSLLVHVVLIFQVTFSLPLLSCFLKPPII